jgi:hypothetical protein
MGWTSVALDQGSLPPVPAPFDLRFVGRLAHPILVQDTPLVRWNHVAPLPFDPLKDLSEMRLKVYPFRLLQGHDYAIHIMSRDKAHKNRDAVLSTLASEGFEMSIFSETRRNTRVPKKPNTSVSFWVGVGQWTKAHAMVTSEDPFFFEDVVEVGRPPGPVVVGYAP